MAALQTFNTKNSDMSYHIVASSIFGKVSKFGGIFLNTWKSCVQSREHKAFNQPPPHFQSE